MIFLHSAEYGKKTILPGIMGLSARKNGCYIWRDYPANKIIDIPEMIVERHSAYTALRCDIHNSNPG